MTEPQDAEVVDETPTTTTHFTHRETALVQQEELAEEREVRRREAQRKIAEDSRRRQEERRKRGDQARSHGIPSNQSEVRYEVAGQSYPLINVVSCKTCQSPYRAKIEQDIAHGIKIGWIANQLPDDANLSAQNIWDHSRKHLPHEIATSQAIREFQAERIGKSITDGIDTLIDEVTLAQEVMAATVKGMVSGDLQPSISDGLRAAQLLHTFQSEENGSIDQQAYTASMMRYFQIAQQTMPDDVFLAFIEGVKRDPILKALADKAAEPPAIEAEAID